MDAFLERFSETSLVWGLGLLLVVAAFFALRAFIGFKTVAKEAPLDFTYKQSQGMLPPGTAQPAYVRAYKRYHAPRAPLHVAAVLAAIAILTLPALGVFYAATFVLWELNGKDKVFAPGLIVHSLLMFFLIIFFWAGLAFLAARHYHSKAPISLELELEKEQP